MSSPRIRRLRGDYLRLMDRFERWPLVIVEAMQGQPPDAYRVTYYLRGLFADDAGVIRERSEHVLEVRLSLEYPRRAPSLRLLTPIFHPNFNRGDVCAQDIYAASEGLDDLIVRIGRMIAYQQYNTKSPLNGIAAKWAEQNGSKLPVDSREISPPALHDTPGTTADHRRASEARVDEDPKGGRHEVSESLVLTTRCSLCENVIQTDDDAEVAWCPYCSKPVVITCAHERTDSKKDTTFVVCQYCEQRLEVDTDMIGEVVECPACTKIIVLK